MDTLGGGHIAEPGTIAGKKEADGRFGRSQDRLVLSPTVSLLRALSYALDLALVLAFVASTPRRSLFPWFCPRSSAFSPTTEPVAAPPPAVAVVEVEVAAERAAALVPLGQVPRLVSLEQPQCRLLQPRLAV